MRLGLTRRIAGALLALGVAGVTTQAQKGKPLPPPHWPCTIEFGDAASDKIKSDGAGVYIDGEYKVQCYINRGGGGNDGNLFVNADSTSPRWFFFPENVAVAASPRGGYAPFANRQPGYFEITDIHDVLYVVPTAENPSPNGPAGRRVRVGVGGSSQFDAGEFWGDGLATDALTSGTHSAVVVATGPCSWQIAWESSPGRVVALREGHPRARTRTGDFQLPFSATVRVTGVKPGCPAS